MSTPTDCRHPRRGGAAVCAWARGCFLASWGRREAWDASWMMAPAASERTGWLPPVHCHRHHRHLGCLWCDATRSGVRRFGAAHSVSYTTRWVAGLIAAVGIAGRRAPRRCCSGRHRDLTKVTRVSPALTIRDALREIQHPIQEMRRWWRIWMRCALQGRHVPRCCIVDGIAGVSSLGRR